MEKNFDLWNSEKKLLDKKVVNKALFFHAREIWWCSAGLNIGVEIDGKNDNFERPMLIVRKFNSDMVWVVPFTKKERIGPYYLKLSSKLIKSSLILSQIKTISTKRLLRKVGTISETEFILVLTMLQNILKIENPTNGVFSEA